MGKGVGREQKAEVVGNDGVGNGADGKDCKPEQEGGEEDSQHREATTPGKGDECAFYAGKERRAQARPRKEQEDCDDGEDELKEDGRD